MKPLVVELIEMLLAKGEVVKMTTSFHGNTLDCCVKSANESILPGAFKSDIDGYIFQCEFHDDLIDETQECSERRSMDELEMMGLHKVKDEWFFY